MLLVKHTPGKPLTAAELRQRRNAARARWAVGGIAAGAIGAIAGAAHQAIRHGVFSAASAERVARQQAARSVRAGYVARVAEIARQTDKRERILRDFEAQLGSPVVGRPRRTVQDTLEGGRVRTEATVQQRILAENMTRQAAGFPQMTAAEQKARFDELMSEIRRQPTAAAPPTSTRLPVGNIENKLVYDRDIQEAGRRLQRAERWRDRLIREEIASGGDPEFTREAARVRPALAEIASIQKEISDLQRFKRLAFTPQARAAAERAPTTRRTKRGEPVEVKGARVKASVVRQARGGEPIHRTSRTKAGMTLEERVAARRTAIQAKRARVLRVHGGSAAVNIAAAERRAIEQEIAAVGQGYHTGEIASRILRRAGRGALIGAVAGLSAAGIAALAHHVVMAGRRRRLGKFEDIDFFEPLAKAQSPEDRAAIRLARLYRRWIDRLLGRDERPVDLGDGFVEALGPHITEAYAKGLTSPPITGPDDPRYRIEVDFDLLNPAQRRHIAEYALDRIVEITDAQREAIRAAIADQSVMRGIGPLEVARTIKEAIGLTTYQRAVVASFRTQLDQLDPRALERELRDKRYDRTVRAAIETNTPLEAAQVDAMVDAYHRKMLALRSQTIARTEALRATSYGGLARAQEVMDRHPELEVTKRWLATDDNRTRDTHRDLNGKEVDGMTSHFVTSAGNTLRWPLDETGVAEEVINCRCTLQYIFKPKRGQLMAVAA